MVESKPSGKRAVERCDALGGGAFSDSPDMLFRPYLGAGHIAALEQVGEWMRDAGMTTRIDAAGNLIGRYSPTPFMGFGGADGDHEVVGGAASAKCLIIASHIDSVRDAGRYDGPLGVMLGIECVSALHATGRRLPFAIEVYAFGDEEGSRFPSAMLCSRAVVGTLAADALSVRDRDGVTLDEALQAISGSAEDFLNARRDPAEWLGYLEAHIEQGPVLEDEGLALGVVTAIAAQRRYEVMVIGVAGHAGTNSMDLRRDALTAAAEMVLAVERVARTGPEGLVATVGRMTVEPGAPNVVPGKVSFTIDVRAGTESLRDAAAERILSAMADVLQHRAVTLRHRLVHDLPASPCDPAFMDILSEAVMAAGQPARRIVSGAGHDAMVFSALTPTAMLFIRCKDGVSHNPLESVEPADVEAALDAMLGFIDRLEASHV